MPMRQLVICARRYNGHELWTLLGKLQESQVEFEVVSTDLLIKDELTFRPNTVERTVWDVMEGEVEDFDGISIVSGNMADTEEYWDNAHVLSLLKVFKKEKKVISAVCCSVPTLAGICKGTKVSFFPLIRSRDRLLRGGALLQTVSLTTDYDHLTTTAENQMLSFAWAESIVCLLKGEKSPHEFVSSGYELNFRGKTPRKLKPDVEKALTRYRPTPAMVKSQKGQAKKDIQ